MKVSFVCTILNEEKNIKNFIDSIKAQTKKPDEIIIVDAGSTDKTISIIKKHKGIKLIIKKKINRSQARNLAIKVAKHKIITVSDAGCTLDEDWLKNITSPFKNKSVGAVAGFYHVLAHKITVFQKSIAPFVATTPDKFNPKTYLPSSRSLAFKKSAWQKIGGYPENLNYCEDLVFAKNLKRKTNLIVKPNAIVYWQMVTNLKAYFQQIKNYARGDIKARYKPHLKKILSVFIRYILFTGFPPAFILYLFWPIFKHFQYVKHPLAFVYLPLIQLTTDLAIISATLQSVKIPL